MIFAAKAFPFRRMRKVIRGRKNVGENLVEMRERRSETTYSSSPGRSADIVRSIY